MIGVDRGGISRPMTVGVLFAKSSNTTMEGRFDTINPMKGMGSVDSANLWS